MRQLTLDDVDHVYRGDSGKCCCGCSGTHTYLPGFPGSDGEEQDEEEVQCVLDIVNDAIRLGTAGNDGDNVHYDGGRRDKLFIVYLKDGVDLTK